MRVFIFITIVAFLFSCKKGGLNYVKGTVREDISGEPIKGATVYLYEDRNKKDGRYLDSVLTNEKGEYTINFSKNAGKRYYVSCKCDKYFGSTVKFDKEIEHGRNAVNFSLSPFGYLRFRYIKNTNSTNYLAGLIDGRYVYFHSPKTSNLWPDFTDDTYDITDSEAFPIHGDRTHTMCWDVKDYFATTFVNVYPNTYIFYLRKGDTLNYTFSYN
jgi:hypothetical protein